MDTARRPLLRASPGRTSGRTRRRRGDSPGTSSAAGPSRPCRIARSSAGGLPASGAASIAMSGERFGNVSMVLSNQRPARVSDCSTRRLRSMPAPSYMRHARPAGSRKPPEARHFAMKACGAGVEPPSTTSRSSTRFLLVGRAGAPLARTPAWRAGGGFRPGAAALRKQPRRHGGFRPRRIDGP